MTPNPLVYDSFQVGSGMYMMVNWFSLRRFIVNLVPPYANGRACKLKSIHTYNIYAISQLLPPRSPT